MTFPNSEQQATHASCPCLPDALAAMGCNREESGNWAAAAALQAFCCWSAYLQMHGGQGSLTHHIASSHCWYAYKNAHAIRFPTPHCWYATLLVRLQECSCNPFSYTTKNKHRNKRRQLMALRALGLHQTLLASSIMPSSTCKHVKSKNGLWTVEPGLGWLGVRQQNQADTREKCGLCCSNPGTPKQKQRTGNVKNVCHLRKIFCFLRKLGHQCLICQSYLGHAGMAYLVHAYMAYSSNFTICSRVYT